LSKWLFIRAAFARAYVRIKGGNREPSWILWEVVLPLLMISSVVYAYQSLKAPPEYIGFVILGGAMMSFWFNVLWGMGSSLYWEKETGNLEAFMTTPSPLEGLLLGMAIGGMVNTATRALSIIVMGSLFFNVKFEILALPSALLIFLLTLLALYTLGIGLASLYLMYSRSGWRASELLQEPIMFISGLYYPLSVLPTFLQIIASLFPLAVGLDGIRKALIYNASLAELGVHVLLLVMMSVILAFTARKLLRYMEWKAKIEGRLILRWM